MKELVTIGCITAISLTCIWFGMPYGEQVTIAAVSGMIGYLSRGDAKEE